MSHLRVFGCTTYALVNLRVKLDDKSVKCVFVGYAPQSKAYRLYNPLTGKIIISRSLIFNEDARWNWKEANKVECKHKSICNFENLEEKAPVTDQVQSSPSSTPPSNHSSSSSSSSDDSPPARLRSLAEIYESCGFALRVTEPTSFDEAVNEVEWHAAMKE